MATKLGLPNKSYDTSTDVTSNSTAFRVARLTVILLFSAWLIDYIDRLVITLALPAIGKQFSLDKAEQGLILTVFFMAYAFFQMPGGILADKIGARKTMTIALAAWSIFTGFTGLAFSYASLLIIRAIFGITEGIFPAASMKALTERTEPKQRSTANGFMFCSNSLGAALAPLIAGPALAAVGWKNSFFLVAILGVVMAVVLWRFLPKPLATSGAPAPAVVQYHRTVRIRDVLTSRTMWLLAMTFCGYDIVSWGLVAWTPSYLMEVRHINVRSSGVLTSIPFFVGTAGTILGGFLFDKFFHDRSRLLIVPAMICTGIFLWVMIRATTLGQFILFESLAVGVMSLTFMPIYGVPMRLLPREVSGVGMGLVNFGGQFAGAFTPFIMGALADSFSFSAAFSFLLFGVVLAIVSSLASPQTKAGFAASFGTKMAAVPS
jgi:sugar phosphate permease